MVIGLYANIDSEHENRRSWQTVYKQYKFDIQYMNNDDIIGHSYTITVNTYHLF